MDEQYKIEHKVVCPTLAENPPVVVGKVQMTDKRTLKNVRGELVVEWLWSKPQSLWPYHGWGD